MTEVIHTPFGQEHPYEQLPEERFPRQPLAGESFTIGIVTRPPGQIKHVRVLIRVDGVDQTPVEAVLVSDWQQQAEHGVGAEFLERIVRIEQDVWQAKLTAPPFGSTMIYTLEADGATYGSYTLKGEAWQTILPHTLDRSSAVAQDTTAVDSVDGLPSMQKIEWLSDGFRARRVKLTFAAHPDEAFFGVGERYNALNQRGEILDVRVYEQYKTQGKRAYMPIPFLLSAMGYGLWVKSSRWMQFDLCATSPDQWTLEADLDDDQRLHLQWIQKLDESQRPDLLRIISKFTDLTGKPVLPPLWSFGLWMSSNEWNSQTRVEQEVAASFEHGITPSVVVIEAWSDETTFYIWNDAQYTPKSGDQFFRYDDFTFPPEGKWTNPKAMIDQLHAQGIKLILWQIPAMKRADQAHAQHDADRAYFAKHGYGVHDPDGTLHQIRPFWFRNGWIWDVTNADARAWWLNKRAYLLDDMGVDGFKTDGGEHLWSTQAVFADGRTGVDVWNEYPKHYTQAYYDFSNAHRNNDAVMFSRAGFTGSQTSPAHWAGDENSTWDAYRSSILGGLSAAASGISFWGWDIGGFSGEIPSAELYLRGAAMAAFCPIFQYHSEYNAHRIPRNDRTPWNLQARTGDERLIPTFRFLTNVRHNLMPYIWQEAQYSAQTGEPMMRALRWMDADPRVSNYQYFFGRDLLVCPVTEPETTRIEVYLPRGMWHDLWTGKAYQGESAYWVDVPLDRIPVFVRGGSKIPVRFGASGKLGDAVTLSAEANAEIKFD